MLFFQQKNLFSSNSLPLFYMPWLVKAGEFSSHSLCTLLFEIINMCLEFGLLPVYVIMEILDYKWRRKHCKQTKKNERNNIPFCMCIKWISLRSLLLSGNHTRLLLYYTHTHTEIWTHTRTLALATLIFLFILIYRYLLCMFCLFSLKFLLYSTSTI